MTSVTLTDARTHLSALVERALRGEVVTITRRGKAVAQLLGLNSPRRPVDVEALRALTESMATPGKPASRWFRRVRDRARY
jgi:prevent-host-death family protein